MKPSRRSASNPRTSSLWNDHHLEVAREGLGYLCIAIAVIGLAYLLLVGSLLNLPLLGSATHCRVCSHQVWVQSRVIPNTEETYSRAVSVPFALLYIENRVLRAICCRLSC